MSLKEYPKTGVVGTENRTIGKLAQKYMRMRLNRNCQQTLTKLLKIHCEDQKKQFWKKISFQELKKENLKEICIKPEILQDTKLKDQR